MKNVTMGNSFWYLIQMFLFGLSCRAAGAFVPSTLLPMPTSFISCRYATEDSGQEIKKNNNNTDSSIDDTDDDPVAALSILKQAEKLRAEAEAMRVAVDTRQELKIQKQIQDVDKWIDHVLVNLTINEDTQMLNTVERATELLRDGRYSQEQVNKMFDRILETSTAQSRSNCSPLLALLVDAAGKLDEIERMENPNKRWNGRVERELRKRLFTMDYGFDMGSSTKDNTMIDRFN